MNDVNLHDEHGQSLRCILHPFLVAKQHQQSACFDHLVRVVRQLLEQLIHLHDCKYYRDRLPDRLVQRKMESYQRLRLHDHHQHDQLICHQQEYQSILHCLRIRRTQTQIYLLGSLKFHLVHPLIANHHVLYVHVLFELSFQRQSPFYQLLILHLVQFQKLIRKENRKYRIT